MWCQSDFFDCFLLFCLFCTISYHIQLNCKCCGEKNVQFLSCQWSTLNRNWDRKSDRQWQKLMCESEVLTETFLSVCYCTLLKVFLTGSEQVLTLLKTLWHNHISYWMYNLEKQMKWRNGTKSLASHFDPLKDSICDFNGSSNWI